MEMTPSATTPSENDRLLEKQWQARIRFNACPFRRAYNQRWKAFFNRRAKSGSKVWLIKRT